MSRVRKIAVELLRKIAGRQDIRAAWRWRKLALQKRIYREPVTPEQLRASLVALGVRRGQTLWVQSSWNDFYNFTGTPTAVIDMMLELIGSEGTLAMPAIPMDSDPNKVLKIDTAPVSTGMLCELFRRYPGVKRSVHLTASVIAKGPNAEFLVKDHHLTHSPWDPDSPFMRLREVDALCLSLGLGEFLTVLTPLHAVESILRHEMPRYAQIMSGEKTYRWQRRDGTTGEHTFLIRNGTVYPTRLGRHYPKDKYRRIKLSNLVLWSVGARDAIDIGVDLARRGISMYDRWPRPRRV